MHPDVNNQDFCRICESSKDLEMIFKEENSETLSLLRSLSPWPIEFNDWLPQHICLECIQSTKETYHFKSSYNKTTFKYKSEFQRCFRVDNKDLTDQQAHENNISDIVIKTELGIIDTDGERSNLHYNVESTGLEASNLISKEELFDYSNGDRMAYTNGEQISTKVLSDGKTELCSCSQCGMIFNCVIDAKDQDQNTYSCRKCQTLTIPADVKRAQQFQVKITVPTQQLYVSPVKDPVQLKLTTSTAKTIQIHPSKPKADSFNCTSCGKSFNDLGSFESHQVILKCPNLYPCDECKRSFNQKDALITHKNMHSNGFDSDIYPCNKCEKTYKTFTNLNNHLKLHADPDIFACKICGKKCSSPHVLKEHESLHTDPDRFKCNKCGKLYTRLESFRRHMSFHENPDRFKCDECGVTFGRILTLRNHKALHSNPQLFECKDCGKTFSTASSLKVHKKVHVNPNIYQCNQCGKKLSGTRRLKEHELLHKNPELFKRSDCGKIFSQNFTYQTHLRVATHLDTEMRTCPKSENVFVPESIRETAKAVQWSRLPEHLKLRYTATYDKFKMWQKEQGTSSFDEDVLLAYFSQMDCAPPTLFSRFYMLRSYILAYNNIDISKYPRINQYLKNKNEGYQTKKGKVLTTKDITRLCNECTDPNWLVLKVVCIFGITGACRREELAAIELGDVEDHQTMLLVKIAKTKTPRSFNVVGEFYEICKQYLNIRNQQIGNTRFFNKMLNGICDNQPIGINKIGSMPKMIAEFLKLPEPKLYTGHRFRRSSITLLADGEADITTVKRHSGHKSTAIPESYIENSIQNKKKSNETITKSIDVALSTSAKRSSENAPSEAKKQRIELYHDRPSTLGTKQRINKPAVVIPETQSSIDSETSSTITHLTSVSQQKVFDEIYEFEDDFTYNLIKIGTQRVNALSVNEDLKNSQHLSNILKLDEKNAIELHNCSNITFNIVSKKN